jgi:hypothetical protein
VSPRRASWPSFAVHVARGGDGRAQALSKLDAGQRPLRYRGEPGGRSQEEQHPAVVTGVALVRPECADEVGIGGRSPIEVGCRQEHVVEAIAVDVPGAGPALPVVRTRLAAVTGAGRCAREPDRRAEVQAHPSLVDARAVLSRRADEQIAVSVAVDVGGGERAPEPGAGLAALDPPFLSAGSGRGDRAKDRQDLGGGQ